LIRSNKKIYSVPLQLVIHHLAIVSTATVHHLAKVLPALMGVGFKFVSDWWVGTAT